jgi:hypothetical protein
MPTFHTTECSLTLADGWTERSISIFVDPANANANITLTREPLAGRTLEALAHQHLGRLAQELPHYALVERAERTLGPLAAAELRFHWRDGRVGCLEQRQLLVPYYEQLLSFTGSAPLAHHAALATGWEQARSSLRFRRG